MVPWSRHNQQVVHGRAHGSLVLVAASAARQSEKFSKVTGILSSLRQHTDTDIMHAALRVERHDAAERW